MAATPTYGSTEPKRGVSEAATRRAAANTAGITTSIALTHVPDDLRAGQGRSTQTAAIASGYSTNELNSSGATIALKAPPRTPPKEIQR
jgi:hypothetical protein